MNKTILILFTIIGSITACTNVEATKVENTDGIQWDFDHQVQFIKTTVTDQEYQLKIIPNKKVSFDRLSAFLLRKSFSLCQGYQFQLSIEQGIEGFDDKRASPNYIARSLIANISCKQS